jgi:NTE family protein
VANTPLKPELAYEPDAVIVVSAAGIARPAPPPASLGDAIGLLAENVAHFALLSDYRHAEQVNVLAAAAPQATEKKPVELLLIEPTGLPFTTSGFLRFDPDDARRLIEHGRTAAERALAEWPVL